MMRMAMLMLSVLVTLGMFGLAERSGEMSQDDRVRFIMVDLFIESGDHPLAAYQLSFRAAPEEAPGRVRIVGIEGGDHPLFADPPRYDPRAMEREEVILAEFSTAPAEKLPSGRFRIASIHLEVRGEWMPRFHAELTVAADANGRRIPARLTIEHP